MRHPPMRSTVRTLTREEVLWSYGGSLHASRHSPFHITRQINAWMEEIPTSPVHGLAEMHQKG